MTKTEAQATPVTLWHLYQFGFWLIGAIIFSGGWPARYNKGHMRDLREILEIDDA